MAHAATVSFAATGAESGIIDGAAIKNDSHSSGITWSAVIGGAFVSAALSLILLSLGTGLGLSAVSPWSNSGFSGATISKGAILWLILMQALGSLMGGYLAGRLRTKWAKIHSDEVYFRDTAHGFLVCGGGTGDYGGVFGFRGGVNDWRNRACGSGRACGGHFDCAVRNLGNQSQRLFCGCIAAFEPAEFWSK